MIDDKEIEKLAQLARIKISKKETEKLSRDLDSILAYISEIKDVSSVSSGAEKDMNLVNVMREDDEPHDAGIYTEKLLAEAPQRQDNYIKVKKIL